MPPDQLGPMNYLTRDRLYEELIYHFPDINDDQRKSVNHYFVTGDIDKYISDSLYIEPAIATFFAPQHDIEHVKYRIQKYWDWLLENMGHEADIRFNRKLSMDEQFHRTMGDLYTKMGALLPPDLFGEVFRMTFGDTFVKARDFPMTFGRQKWQPKIIHEDVDGMCINLLSCIDGYVFGVTENDIIDSTGFKHTMDYFLSVLPYLSEKFYSTTLYDKKHRINGKRSRYRGRQTIVRHFLGHIEGFIDEEMEQFGCAEIRVNDKEALAKLNKGIEALILPDEFHRLREFIRVHGDEAKYVSE